MTTEQLKEMLQGMSETPSPHCWEAVQQQIGAAVGSATTAAASKGASVASKGASVAAKGAFSAGKIAAISAAAATIVVGTVISVVSFVSSPKTDFSIANNSQSELIEPVVVDSAMFSEIVESPDVSSTAQQSTVADNTPDATLQTQEHATNPVMQTPAITPTPTPSSQNMPLSSFQPLSNNQNPTPQTSTQIPNSAASLNSSAPNPKPKSSNAAPIPQQVIASHNADPLTENIPQETIDKLKESVSIVIPNTITPNGDGYNDTWIIKGLEKCEEYQLSILNSSRKEIFRTKRYENNWDASEVDGNQFFYILVYKVNGIQEKRTGTITIFR